jgi:hypothetical protein
MFREIHYHVFPAILLFFTRFQFHTKKSFPWIKKQKFYMKNGRSIKKDSLREREWNLIKFPLSENFSIFLHCFRRSHVMREMGNYCSVDCFLFARNRYLIAGVLMTLFRIPFFVVEKFKPKFRNNFLKLN